MTVSEHVLLAPYTTLKIGGKARYFCIARSVDDLRLAKVYAEERKLSICVLGGGSNVLISDEGFSGLVIKNEIKGREEEVDGESIRIKIGAGEDWDEIVHLCVTKGYWGMENLSAIPGTVGAAPVQNIGAYGSEVKDIIESVYVFDMLSGEENNISNTECRFGYRDSIFKLPESKGLIITKVTFLLSLKPRPLLSYKDLDLYFSSREIVSPTVKEIREAVVSIRSSKFPDLSTHGTAGSFWKNPLVNHDVFERLKAIYPLIPSYPADPHHIKIPLAWILDVVCGLKGYTKKSISLFKNQPLVLTVSEIGATASEIDAFACEIEEKVKEKTGISIEREVQKISSF